jgi:hypothetical protein
MFSTGVYFKIWNVTNKGKYSEVECSTSKKNNQTGRYETDFSSKFVKFIGNAHTKAPQPNERIKVTSCGVQNVFESNGQKQYLKSPTYLVFDFEREGGGAPMGNGFTPTANGGYTPSAYGGLPGNFEEMATVGDGDLPF